MSYVKSLRRERSRDKAPRSRRGAMDLFEDEFLSHEAEVILKITNRNRSRLDRKLKAAQTRDVDALINAEWED